MNLYSDGSNIDVTIGTKLICILQISDIAKALGIPEIEANELITEMNSLLEILNQLR